MKKTEKKALGKSLLTSGLEIVKGVATGINPIVGAIVGAGQGAVKSVQKIKEDNLNSETGGKGAINMPHLLGVIVACALIAYAVYMLATGKIDLDTFNEIIKASDKLQ